MKMSIRQALVRVSSQRRARGRAFNSSWEIYNRADGSIRAEHLGRYKAGGMCIQEYIEKTWSKSTETPKPSRALRNVRQLKP
jgi:hypothetical protein